MAVYDDEKTKTPGSHDDLGVHPERREAETADLEKAYAAPSAGARAKDQEQSDNAFGFHNEKGGEKGLGNRLKNLGGRWKNLKKKTKLKIAALGAGGVAGVIVLLIVTLIVGSLIIPNFAASITSYQMARVTRESVATESVVDAQKIALDSSSDSLWTRAKAKWQNLRDNTWGKFDQYRPQKVQENLEATDQLSYHYTDPSKILHRQRMDSLTIGDQQILVPENTVSTIGKISNPIDFVKGAIKTRISIYQAVSTTLRDSNFLVRALVTKNLIEKLGGHLFRWTSDQEKQSQGESEKTGDINNAEQSYDISTDDGALTAEAAEGTTTNDIAEATNNAAEAQKEAYSDPTLTAAALANGGGLAPKAISAIGSALTDATFTKIVNILSPTATLFIPICMVLAASADNSGPQIDAASAEAENSYIGLQASADQQKAGATTPELVGAESRQLGQVANSNAQLRASGVPVDTGNTPGAQQPVGGYQRDLLTTFLPTGLATAIEIPLKPACNVATTPEFGLAVAAVTLLPGIGQGIAAAEDATVATVGKIIGTEIGNVARNLFTKKGLVKLTAATVATVGASELAHLLVLTHTGSIDDGTARDTDYDNQVDMGGNLFANELDRVQNAGAPMTNQNVDMLASTDQNFREQEIKSQSVFQRYFAITNPGSLANTVAVDIGTHANLQSFSSLLTSIPRILNPVSLLSRMSSLLQPVQKVSAAADVDTEDYGDVQWGWNAAEEDVYEHNPNYQPLVNQAALDQSGQEDAITSKYSKCFDGSTSQGTLLAEGDIVRTDNGDIITNQGLCAPDNVGFSQEDSSGNPIFANPTAQLVYRYRVATRNNNGLDNAINQQTITP